MNGLIHSQVSRQLIETFNLNVVSSPQIIFVKKFSSSTYLTKYHIQDSALQMDNLHWKNERFLESNFTNGGAFKGDGQVILKLLSQNWNVVDAIRKTAVIQLILIMKEDMKNSLRWMLFVSHFKLRKDSGIT